MDNQIGPMSRRVRLILFGIAGLLLVALFVIPGLVDGGGVIPASVGIMFLLFMATLVFGGLGAVSFIVGPLVRLRSVTLPLLIMAIGVAFFYDVPSTAVCRVFLGPLDGSLTKYDDCDLYLDVTGIVFVVLGGFVFFRVLAVFKEEKRRKETERGT